MNIVWQRALALSVRELFEQAGYHFFIDPITQRESFVMRVGRQFYPRYHVYVQQLSVLQLEIDLHIDQTQHSGDGQRAHRGEYDGLVVEEEMLRLIRWFEWGSH